MLQKSPATARGGPDAPIFPDWTRWAADVWQPMVTASVALGAKAAETAAELSGEYLGFVNRRVNADLAFAQRMMSCTRPEDGLRAYSEFVQKAIGDYQGEMAKVAKLAVKLGFDSAEAVKDAGKAAHLN